MTAPLGPVRLQGVSHTHAAGSPWAHAALRDVDLVIEPGERVAVVGGNGAGKSTLAHVLAGVVAPTVGRARLGDVDLVDASAHLGLVVQHARLQLLRPTVDAELDGLSGGHRSAAWEMLRLTGFGRLMGRRVDELSGGEQRIVALTGTLARAPRLVVLDEPLAGLDPAARRGVVTLLHRFPGSVAVVTHDRDPLEEVVTRTVHLAGGRVVATTGVSR